MSAPRDLDVVVVGGGSFGSALAQQLARLERRLLLWVRRPEQAAEINEQKTNNRYLEGFSLSANLSATNDISVVARAPVVLVVVPSRSFRAVAHEMGEHLRGDQAVVHATKGLEQGTFNRMSEILREETCALKVGVLSGPNLARELMAEQPSGALVASRFDLVIGVTQALFVGSPLRTYGGHDVIGTEIGGAFKNIIALAAGVADGMGFGDNTKALLVTRGLSEMARFGVAMGADVFTFGGLAGIGDLMATCGSPLSRNHQVGERLGRGESLEAILASMSSVAEGVPTTKAVHDYAAERKLDLPIVEAVWGMLYGGRTAVEAVAELMAIPVGTELAALRFK